ncbi:MAG: radical SAM family heme chaperone HemW [Rhodospirillales bacterium]
MAVVDHLHGNSPADTGFGIYIHWPFCTSKCPYCDFNSHVAGTIDQGRWRAALMSELSHFAGETGGRTVTSIFFGGGTPSLMDPGTVADLIAAVGGHWPVSGAVEITLEANPTSVEAGRFQAFRAAGVNRLSLGVQALDDRALAFLGRGHSAAEAINAVALAAAHFPRFSFDLIYGRPGQTVPAWRRELAQALEFADGHLSVYQLTIEPGTRFHAEGVDEADEETGAALYQATHEVLGAAGLAAYEISNHARPGAECRHNLTYWRGGDYVGVGPGAHGRLTAPAGALPRTEAVNQTRMPEHWLSAVEARGHGTAQRTVLSPEARGSEVLMMGLRLSEGVSRERFRRLTGRRLEDAVDTARLRDLIDGGFLILDDRRLRATAAGHLRLNAVLAAVLAC